MPLSPQLSSTSRGPSAPHVAVAFPLHDRNPRVPTRVEIKFQAPHAIDAMLSPS